MISHNMNAVHFLVTTLPVSILRGKEDVLQASFITDYYNHAPMLSDKIP